MDLRASETFGIELTAQGDRTDTTRDTALKRGPPPFVEAVPRSGNHRSGRRPKVIATTAIQRSTFALVSNALIFEIVEVDDHGRVRH